MNGSGCHLHGGGGIGVFDTSSGQLIKTIRVGIDPEQLAVDRGEHRLYVSNEETGTATAIDSGWSACLGDRAVEICGKSIRSERPVK